MKQSPLRSDPAKVKEFQNRSRQPLARDPTKGLARDSAKALGREGMRSTELRRSATGWQPMDMTTQATRKRKSKPKDPMRAALAVAFRAKRPARTQQCVRCKVRRATGHHHWLPQEALRVMMRGMAKALALTPEQVERRLREWLRDEGNLSPMCARCHLEGELEGWERSEVPGAAWRFAQDLDAELEVAGCRREAWVRLLRNYPDPELLCS